MTGPRVKAMLIAPNGDLSAHAVSLLPPTVENPGGYHRLIGGGVEFGESHEAAVRREVREELGSEIVDLRLLGTVESSYEIDGRPGHEIVFLYTGRLDPSPPVTGGFLTEDGDRIPVVWRTIDDVAETLPLYPAAAGEHVRRLAGPAARLDQRRATIDAYDRFADAYADAAPALTADLVRELGHFAAAVDRTGTVLEIGSAGGRDALAIEDAGVRVDRTDISAAFVERLRRAGHSARALDPLRDEIGGPYAGVWANAVLLHLDRFEFAITLRRLYDATVPGGSLFLTLKEGDGEGWSRHGAIDEPRHFTYWREPDLRRALAAARWEIDQITQRDGRKLGERWLTVHARR